MEQKRSIGLVAAGLIAGLVLGSIGIATAATVSSAAPSTATSSTAGQTAPRDGRGGPGGPGGQHGPGGIEARGAGDIAEALANLTDLSESDIQTKRAAGTSYAAIAKAEGVSSDELIAETVKIETAELNADVKAGTISSAQRTQVLKGLKSFLATEITRTDELRGPRGPGGPGGRHGQHPTTDDGTTTEVNPSTDTTL